MWCRRLRHRWSRARRPRRCQSCTSRAHAANTEACTTPRSLHHAADTDRGWSVTASARRSAYFCPAPISFAAAVAAIRRLTTSTAAATCRADSLSFRLQASATVMDVRKRLCRVLTVHSDARRTRGRNPRPSHTHVLITAMLFILRVALIGHT